MTGRAPGLRPEVGPMVKEAAEAGSYKSPFTEERFPRILAVEQLIAGAQVAYPQSVRRDVQEGSQGHVEVTLALPLGERGRPEEPWSDATGLGLGRSRGCGPLSVFVLEVLWKQSP